MTTKLHNALKAYKQILLDTAAGDLLAQQACLPRGNVAINAMEARAAVLKEAAKLPSERFVAELMAANFLGA